MGAGRSLLTPRRQAWGVTRLTGGQQPSAAGGTCEKMYKRQQLVCERLSPVPRCCITRAQRGFGSLRSSVRKREIQPSLEHLYRHQWPGAGTDVQRCSTGRRKSSGSESPARCASGAPAEALNQAGEGEGWTMNSKLDLGEEVLQTSVERGAGRGLHLPLEPAQSS